MNDMENVLNQIIVFSKQDASSLSTTTNNSNSTSTNDNDIDLLGITVTMVRIMKGNNHKVSSAVEVGNTIKNPFTHTY